MGKRKQGLGEALFPKVKRQLLTCFFVRPQSRLYGREVSRLINGSHGSVRRELKTLVNAGILKTAKEGRQRYYWADRDCMIFAELRGIVVKTFGVVESIRDSLADVANGVRIAAVFGSIASGEDTARSDIDLLVIGDLSFGDLVVSLGSAEKTLGRTISPVLLSAEEYRTKYSRDEHFIRSVTRTELLFVKGTQSELEELARQPLVES